MLDDKCALLYWTTLLGGSIQCKNKMVLSQLTFKKYKVKQSLYTPWRRLRGEEYSSYSFSTSALDGGERSASRPGRAFTLGERTPGTHCTGGWLGPRAGLDSRNISGFLSATEKTENVTEVQRPCRNEFGN
jgi:hypothetical protein